MRDKPEGATDTDLVSALADGWGLEVRSVDYLPVGFGSYHWSVTDGGGRSWFVTVDDLGTEDGSREIAFAALDRAYGTALALRRDAGLGFVVAPIPTRSGATVRRLNSRYAVSVFPTVDGEAGKFGAHRPQDRAEVIRLLATRADHVRRLLGEFDQLVAQVRSTTGSWVVTHGEPHPGNLIRTAAGLALYRLWWDLADIANYVEGFRQPHRASEDIKASWTYLNGYLE